MTPVFSFEADAQIAEADIEKFLKYIFSELNSRGHSFASQNEIVLAFVSEEKSQQLNSQFRQKDKSTDVLSFGSDDPESVGELILCPQVIERQALKNQWELHHEYCYMILHGLLHLLGYEHETDDKAAQEMYALQDEIFFEYFPGVK